MKMCTGLGFISLRKLIFIFLTATVIFGFISFQHNLNSNFLVEFVGQQYSLNEENLYFMSSRGNRSQLKYLIYTDNCRLQDVNPFDPKQMAHFDTSAKKPDCSSSQSPMELVKNHLKFKDEILNPSYFSSARKLPTCCFKELYRIEKYDRSADTTSFTTECLPVDNSANGTKISAEFIMVKCNSNSWTMGTKKTVAYFAQVFPPDKQSPKGKKKKSYWDRSSGGNQDLKSKNDQETNGNKSPLQAPPSLLVIGIDSTSRLHSIRSIPQTRAFLQQNDFIEMKGHTKTGDHTFANLMAMLAGMNIEETTYDCYPNYTVSTDNCPFIWKQFSQYNYVTAYLEDYLEISNFREAGLRKQPTDYYTKTVLLPYAHGHKFKKPHRCVSGMTEANFLFDYSKKFIKKMARGNHDNETYPYFLFSWMSSIGHDDFNGLHLADQDFLNYFSDILSDTFEGKPKDNTIIIFLGDHGRVFGTGRDSVSGYYEASLPMFFIRLPTSLKLAKPQWSINLLGNSQGLTTPFDLHKTFEHILTLSRVNSSSETQSNTTLEAENFSYSFFTEIPKDRSCESSGVHSTYCRCNIESAEEDLNVEGLSPRYGEAMAQWVNDLLKRRGIFDKCSTLTFVKYAYARELYLHRNDYNEGRNNDGILDYKYFMIAALTQPGNGMFEGMIKINGEENGLIEFIGNLSRISSFDQYWGQNQCMEILDNKMFCTCK